LHAWFEAAFWCKVKDIFAKVQSYYSAIESMLVVSRLGKVLVGVYGERRR
jgi:hypothetical protein